MGLDILGAIGALHCQATFHYLLELLYTVVFLLKNFATALHLLQGRGEVFVGLDQLTVVLALGA